MSSKQAVAKFVSSVAVHFPPPKFDSAEQEAEWLKSIVDSLQEFSDETLDRAWQHIRDHRGLRKEEKWFPVPAELRRVCQEIVADGARKSLFQQQGSQSFDPHKASSHSKVRTQLVIDLVRGEMGRRAATEGWIGALVDHVRTTACLPDESMVKTLRAREREFQEIREQCHEGVGWPMGSEQPKKFAKLGDTIQARNRLWARVVLGQETEDALFRMIDLEANAA